jgi:energy-coupling factor transport system permease protein
VHPLIRIVCFLVLSACLAFGGAAELACGGALIAGAYLATSPRLFVPALTMIYRMRWFLLSLFIVYGWFTPGQPLVGGEGARFAELWPSREGALAGLLRAALLMAIVAGANLLLRTTSREELLVAVYGLARPLGWCGIPRERIAVRMVLVIEALDPVRRIVTERLAAVEGGLPDLRTAGRFASGVMRTVVQQAEAASGGTVQLSAAGAPAPQQWVYPVLLALLFLTTARFGG